MATSVAQIITDWRAAGAGCSTFCLWAGLWARAGAALAAGVVAAALYLVSLLASDQRASRRLVPEALNVLYSVVAILLPPLRAKGAAPAKALAEEFGIPTPDVGAPHTAGLALREDAAPAAPVA